MIEFLQLLLISFITGSTAIVPGVSGGTILAIFSLTEEVTYSIKELLSFRFTKKNLMIPLTLGIGSLVSAFLYANLLTIYFEKYQYLIRFLFVGMILFSIPILWNEGVTEKVKVSTQVMKRRYLYAILGFIVMLIVLLLFGSDSTEAIDIAVLSTPFFLIKYFIASVVAGMTIIIPGISGTNIMIMFGVYPHYTYTMAHVIDYKFIFIIYLIGTVIGIVISSFALSYIYSKYRVQFFSLMTGLTLATIFTIIANPFAGGLIGTVQAVIGIVVSFIFIRYLSQTEK